MFKVFHWWCFNVYDVFDTQLISVLFVSLANLFYCHAAPPIIKAPQFQSSISDTMMTIRLYKASEKHGPITHYILVVVPDDLARTKTPADFKLEEVNISGFLLSGSVIHDPHAPHLTHCGLVMPYVNLELGQYWLRWWLVAWRHQAITCTDVDIS